MLLTSPFCLAARGDCRSPAELATGVGYWHPRRTGPSAAEGAARKSTALADSVNVLIAGKYQAPQWLSMDAAIEPCGRRIGVWPWAGSDRGEEPDVVMACCGKGVAA